MRGRAGVSRVTSLCVWQSTNERTGRRVTSLCVWQFTNERTGRRVTSLCVWQSTSERTGRYDVTHRFAAEQAARLNIAARVVLGNLQEPDEYTARHPIREDAKEGRNVYVQDS